MKNSFRKNILCKSISYALFGSLVMSTAYAAEEVPTNDRDLEVIEVTAERRIANLQETPIAVTALSQENLAEQSIVDVTDLTGFVPSLVISGQEDQSDIKIYIRGVGTNNPTETGDQGVGVYVDGVFAARAQGALALMYDLEGIQVLRGPQGTLFGRNNTGGALLLETVKPGDEFEGDFQMGFGSYNSQQMSGGVTIPVTSNLSFRFAGYMEQDNGWVNAIDTDPRGTEHNFSGVTIGRTANPNKKLNNTAVRSARVTGSWDILQDLNWTLSYEYFEDNGVHGSLLNPVEVEKGNFDSFVDSDAYLDMTTEVVRSTVSYDITDGINIEYIAGTASLDRRQITDQDGGVMSRFQEGRTEYQLSDSSSHEIKIQDTDDGAFSWTAGVYYFEEETNIRFDFDGQGSWLNGGATFIQPARGAESTAVYVQASYAVTEALNLTAGVRYTDDLKYDRGGRNVTDCGNEFLRPTLHLSGFSLFDDQYNNITGEVGGDFLDDKTGLERVAGQCATGSINDVEVENDKTTSLVRADYSFDDHMIYASVATGYRAGEISDNGNYTLPEESTSYEVGSKSDFETDMGDVRLNLSAFYLDYTNLIRSGWVEEAKQVLNSNVAAAEVTGAEVELTWLVGEGGQLDFSGSWINAEYVDYVTNSGGDNPGNALITDGDQAGLYDLGGNSLPQSPEFSFSANFSWEFDTSNGVLLPRINVRYVDDVYFRDQNEISSPINNMVNDEQQTGTFFGVNAYGQEAHSKVNLGVKYIPADGDWALDFYVNNVTDEMTKSSATTDVGTAAGAAGRYAAPRTTGVRFNYSF